ncbi:MAG TPA: HAMP domain-containing sensor histidine kinase, partial [Pyrinomonadaceae bacterium]
MIRVIRRSSLLLYAAALLAAMAALLFAVPGLWQNLFETGARGRSFMTHEHCYLAVGPLVAAHFYSDLLIGLSYVAISFTLAYLVHRARRDIPFHWVFVAFGLFIIACGSTHFMEVATTYGEPRYWLAAYLKLVTAFASVATAVVLPPLVPRALALVREAKLSGERRRELEDANRELAEANRRVRELDELKSQFFANVSHELRTPLALILGPAQKLLAAPDLPAAHRRELETVERNARVLVKHVDDLLDISKLEAGKMTVAYAETDLAELVRLTSGYFHSVAADRRIDYAVEAPPSLVAAADPEKLQRVLVNLISNAIKFTPDGGRVRCALAEAAGGTAVIEVSDTGPGVPAEMREAIFERFRQLEGGAARRFGGTGLGLAIAREL